MRRRRWSAIVVAVAAVIVASFTAYQLAHWPPGRSTVEPAGPASKGTSAKAGGRLAPDTSLAVLGDSFTSRSRSSTGPVWSQMLADRLHWHVYTDAVDGSGYVNPGRSAPFGPRVPALVRHRPDVVILAGGVDDVGAYSAEGIAQAAGQVVTRLRREAPDAHIVLVSPFSNGEPGPLTDELSTKMRAVARQHGVAYVDATRWLVAGGGLFADSTHPTEHGQQRLAREMQQALERLGLVAQEPGRSAAG